MGTRAGSFLLTVQRSVRGQKTICIGNENSKTPNAVLLVFLSRIAAGEERSYLTLHSTPQQPVDRELRGRLEQNWFQVMVKQEQQRMKKAGLWVRILNLLFLILNFFFFPSSHCSADHPISLFNLSKLVFMYFFLQTSFLIFTYFTHRYKQTNTKEKNVSVALVCHQQFCILSKLYLPRTY